MQNSHANVADFLVEAANRYANKIAIVDQTQELSFADLATQAADVAKHLVKLGLNPGDRVAIIVDKRTEVVAAIFGCYLAGMILVPVNPQLKSRQISHILSDSGARAILASEKRSPVLATLDAGMAFQAKITPDCRLVPCFERAPLPGIRNIAAGFEDVPVSTLFYTSGSTGLPKAVACTHDNILAGAKSVNAYLENSTSDTILAILPLSFDAGFSQLTTGVGSGARVILRDYLLPADISRACARYGVTGITGVPAIWGAALRAKWTDEACHTVRYLANTGGHLSQERIVQLTSQFPNARIYPMYGLTEAFRSAYLHPDMIWKKPGSIGKAIPGAVLCVVNENGEECAPRQSGELVHAGPTVAAGYWNNPVETQKRFRVAPAALQRLGHTEIVVFSGDLVWRDEDGFLFYEARRDAQIKISGNRISFAEIEDLGLRHPEVTACAAGGNRFDPESDPELVLFLETNGSDAVADQVMETLRAELPGFSVPSRIFTLDRLIINNNHKYDVGRMVKEHCGNYPEVASLGTD